MEENLEQQGWFAVESVHEGQDVTRALHVKFRDNSNDEIVITWSPEKSDQGVVNRVNTAFFDPTNNNPALRDQRMLSIMAAMRDAQGVECPDAKCVPGTEKTACQDKRRLDFNQIRRAQ